MMAAVKRIRFLMNVCVFVRWMVSPKQPQSCIGLLTVSQRVTSVITTIMIRDILLASRRRIASKSITPKVNSIADSPTDKINCAQSGIYADNCTASKYSAILYCEPKGSIALTKPEKMNVKASRVRLRFTSIDFILFM